MNLRSLSDLFSAPEETLREALSAVRSMSLGSSIVCRSPDKTIAASTGRGQFDTSTRVEIGCVTKILTSILAAVAVSERRLAWTDRVTDVLGSSCDDETVKRHLQDVRLHHLLSNSHGIDASRDFQIQHSRDGLLDANQLLSHIQRDHILYSPGEIPNYSNLGSRLTACILENVYRLPILTILKQKLLDPLELDVQLPSPAEFCPANGGKLSLSANELSLIAKLFVDPRCPFTEIRSTLDEMRQLHHVAMPRRPSVGRRMCLGFTDFGFDSYGHSGYSTNSSVVFRFHPTRRMSLVITSEGRRQAVAVLNVVFGRMLQDLATKRPPLQMSSAELEALQLEPYLGTYRNAKYTVEIQRGDDGKVTARVTPNSLRARGFGGNRTSEYWITAAAEDCFFPMLPERTVISMLHFLHRLPSGHFKFLRTPSHLFARR